MFTPRVRNHINFFCLPPPLWPPMASPHWPSTCFLRHVHTVLPTHPLCGVTGQSDTEHQIRKECHTFLVSATRNDPAVFFLSFFFTECTPFAVMTRPPPPVTPGGLASFYLRQTQSLCPPAQTPSTGRPGTAMGSMVPVPKKKRVFFVFAASPRNTNSFRLFASPPEWCYFCVLV